MEHKLEYIGGRGYSERGDLFGYQIQPSSKLTVPTEGCLEVTLTPKTPFRYRLQYVNISVASGILTIDNCARDKIGQTQLFGFFEENDLLKFGIRLKTEKEIASAFDLGMWNEREGGESAGELRIVHGGVINEEDTWKMLSNYYKDGLIEARANWTLHPGFNRLQVYINENEEKVKKLKAIFNEKCDAREKKEKEDFLKNMGKKESKPKVDEPEKSKKVFERKDWRAENHGLKVVKLTKSVDEKPEKNSIKPEISISKKSEKSEKLDKSQKSVPKKVVAEALVSQNPVLKSNRSERVHTPGKSRKSASSVESSSKETVTKTEVTQNTDLKPSAKPEKVPNQEKKKKKNPCCSII